MIQELVRTAGNLLRNLSPAAFASTQLLTPEIQSS